MSTLNTVKDTVTAAGTAELETDVLVIGWGKGGKTLAKTLGSQGRKVTLVERDAGMVGGTCINVACVPTKALVHRADAVRPGDDPDAAVASAWDFRDALTSKLRDANRAMLEDLDAVTLVQGEARFTGERTVEVRPSEAADGDDDGERLTIRARHVVVNTGTTPLRPEMPGVDLPGVHDSETLQLQMDRSRAPRRAVVVGSGPVGLELASMLAGFGAEVTVLVRGEQILPDESDAVRDSLVEALQGRGVRLATGASATGFAEADGGLRVDLEEGEPIAADIVVLATGRASTAEALDPAAAGIELDEKGFIAVDEHLRTSAPDVWAVGDVNGGPQQTYISLDDHRIVTGQLAGDGAYSRADRVAVPTTVFTTPPLGSVGMTAEQAREAGHEVKVASKPVAKIAAMPRPKIEEDAHGVIEVVVDAATDLVLGARLHCVEAQELVNLVALAMRAGVTASALRDGIWTHPSATEALNEVLGELR
ncbi:pyruvate/2-oxoglutarate dehydrogenase complex dihydrolipoamide dehydrogenase (E3) component [Micrococcus sp. 140720015-1]